MSAYFSAVVYNAVYSACLLNAVCCMHSAFILFVFPNSMFTPLLFCFCFLCERAMSSPDKIALKITLIIMSPILLRHATLNCVVWHIFIDS